MMRNMDQLLEQGVALEIQNEGASATPLLAEFVRSFSKEKGWTPLLKGRAIQAMLDMRKDVWDADFMSGEENPFFWLLLTTPRELYESPHTNKVDEMLNICAHEAFENYKHACRLLEEGDRDEGAPLLYRSRGWMLLLATIGGEIYPQLRVSVREMWAHLADGLVFTDHIDEHVMDGYLPAKIKPMPHLTSGFERVMEQFVDADGYYAADLHDKWHSVVENELAAMGGAEGGSRMLH